MRATLKKEKKQNYNQDFTKECGNSTIVSIQSTQFILVTFDFSQLCQKIKGILRSQTFKLLSVSYLFGLTFVK